jgi:hypothetical protein
VKLVISLKFDQPTVKFPSEVARNASGNLAGRVKKEIFPKQRVIF